MVFIRAWTLCLALILSGCGRFEVLDVSAASMPESEDEISVANKTYEVYPGCELPAQDYARELYLDPINGAESGDGTAENPLKTLEAAVKGKKIQSGDRLILLPGNHGSPVTSRYVTPELLKTTEWIWIDGRPGAILSRLDLRDVNRWLITNVAVTNGTGNLVQFSASSNLVISDSEFYTSMDTTSWTATSWINAASAMFVRNGKCVSILRNKALNVRFGISVGSDNLSVPENRMDVLVKDNLIKNFSGDGIRPIASNITLKNNSIIDSYASSADGDGNHDDAIQGFAVQGKAFDNVVIEGTYVQETTNPNRKFNAGLQGICIFDGLYSNVTVRKNVVIVSAWHGISMYGVRDSLIENNTVAGIIPGRKTWITVPPAKGGIVVPERVVVRNNVSRHLSLHSNVNDENNFTITDPVASFVRYDLSLGIFDLHLSATSIAFNKNAGAY